MRPDRPAVPRVPADPDERVMPIVNAVGRFLVVFQLLAGALLVTLLDTRYILPFRAGDISDPPFLFYAIPIGATTIWLIIAAFAVRHLWREWRDVRAWKEWEKRQR